MNSTKKDLNKNSTFTLEWLRFLIYFAHHLHFGKLPCKNIKRNLPLFVKANF